MNFLKWNAWVVVKRNIMICGVWCDGCLDDYKVSLVQKPVWEKKGLQISKQAKTKVQAFSKNFVKKSDRRETRAKTSKSETIYNYVCIYACFYFMLL